MGNLGSPTLENTTRVCVVLFSSVLSEEQKGADCCLMTSLPAR